MANSVLGQCSQDVLRRLNEQLRECTPLDECPGEQGHGLDYAVRVAVEEAQRVILIKHARDDYYPMF